MTELLLSSAPARIVLVHAFLVTPPMVDGIAIGLSGGMATTILPTLENEARRSAEQRIRALAERLRSRASASIAVETEVELGSPSDVIVALGETRGAERVVVGTHGRRGAARLVLGSVAERVVRASTVPVLVVHAREERRADGDRRASTSGGRMKCSELVDFHVERVQPDNSVADVAIKMRERNIGFLPVCDHLERPVGVVTDRDLAVRGLAESLPATTPVSEVMTTEVITCGVSEEIEVAERLMTDHQLSRIVCVDDAGAVVGIISLSDIAQRESRRTTGKLVADVTAREVHRSE